MSQKTNADSASVIAAIRFKRRPANKLAPGVSAGVSTDRVWKHVSQGYTPEQFAAVLQQLLSDGEIIAMTKVAWVRNDGLQSDRRQQLIKTVPPGVDFSKRCWCVDATGSGFEPDDRPGTAHKRLVEIMLYVKADGLPERVTRLLAKAAA